MLQHGASSSTHSTASASIGPKASAVLYVDAEAIDDQWVFKTLKAMVNHNGQEIDVLG